VYCLVNCNNVTTRTSRPTVIWYFVVVHVLSKPFINVQFSQSELFQVGSPPLPLGEKKQQRKTEFKGRNREVNSHRSVIIQRIRLKMARVHFTAQTTSHTHTHVQTLHAWVNTLLLPNVDVYLWRSSFERSAFVSHPLHHKIRALYSTPSRSVCVCVWQPPVKCEMEMPFSISRL